MDYDFEYVLLDRKMVNEFIRALCRPEPSGYGALPSDNMNVGFGVYERNTGITLAKGYEPDKKEWNKKTGEHPISYYVMSPEGLFGVYCDSNNYKFYCVVSSFFEDKYLDVIKKAIHFYHHGELEKFSQQFEAIHRIPLDAYCRQQYREVYEEWENKWKY